MAIQGNWNSTQAVSPQLRRKWKGAGGGAVNTGGGSGWNDWLQAQRQEQRKRRQAQQQPQAPRYGSPWAHPGASGGNAWSNLIMNAPAGLGGTYAMPMPASTIGVDVNAVSPAQIWSQRVKRAGQSLIDKWNNLDSIGTPAGLGGTYAMPMPESVRTLNKRATYKTKPAGGGLWSSQLRNRLNALGTPTGFGSNYAMPMPDSVRDYQQPIGYSVNAPKPLRLSGKWSALNDLNNMTITQPPSDRGEGRGTSVNRGPGAPPATNRVSDYMTIGGPNSGRVAETYRSPYTDAAGNALNPIDWRAGYFGPQVGEGAIDARGLLNAYYASLYTVPPLNDSVDSKPIFGSYYGSGGWGGTGGWGGGKSWQDYIRMALGNWNIK